MAGEFDGLGVAQTFLDTVLRADAQLISLARGGIVADFSLETTPGTPVYPLVNYYNLDASVIRAMGNIFVAAEPIYGVVVHGTGGYGVISPLVNRLLAVLGNVAGYPITYAGIDFSVDCCSGNGIQTHPDILPGGQAAYMRGTQVRLLIQMIS